MDLATIGFKSDTSGIEQAGRGLDNLADKGERTEKRLDKSSGAISKGFYMVAGAVTAAVTSGAALSKLVAVTREFDVLNAQLITATGSASKATEAFYAIEEFAKTTPYDLAQATTAFNKLVNLGLNPSEEALRSYGNTASAMGKSLDQFIEAVADASVAEFERLKEFGIKAKNQGDTIDFTFRGMTTTVKNNADEIQGYLMGLGQNEFAGSMARRMETLDGAVSNLEDSWNKLFLTVSQAGAGDIITQSVRGAIDMVDELTARIASGEIQARIDALFNKFSGFGQDVTMLLDLIGQMWHDGASIWFSSADESLRLIWGAFKNLPENIRTVIQLTAVEVASLVDYADAYGSAFAEVIGIHLAKLVEKAKVYGGAIVDALNPFGDGGDSIAEKLKQLDQVAADMTDQALDRAKTLAETTSNARSSSIQAIINEREAALNSFDNQITKAEGLTDQYKKLVAERKKTAGGVLASAEVKKTNKVIEIQDKKLEKLIDKVNTMKDSWGDTGNVIIDTFGDITKALNGYGEEITKIAQMEEKLAEEKKKHQPDSNYYKEITQAEEQLATRRTQANLSSFASIAGAAGDMFDEQSKARKTFHKVETALTAVEIAMSMQKAGANALQAISSAFAAPFPLNFAAGAAMIGIMAGLGLFSGSGGSGGPGTSAKDIQKNQGRGTVLGSNEQSSSIMDSMDRYEDIQIEQLSELRNIRDGIRGVTLGIERVVKDLAMGDLINETEGKELLSKTQGGGSLGYAGKALGVLNFGVMGGLVEGIVKSFSSTKKELIDSGIAFMSQTLGDILSSGDVEASVYSEIQTTKKKWWGLKKSRSVDTEFSELDSGISQNLADIFGHIGNSAIQSAKTLGIETVRLVETDIGKITEGLIEGDLIGAIMNGAIKSTEVSLEEALNRFELDLPKISTKGMTAEEVQKELEAVFSQQADLVAEYLVPGIKEYQQVGEGSYETLLRVAKEQVVFNDHLSRTGMVLGDLSANQMMDVSQSLISLMGGFDNFQSAANKFFDEFYSQEEKLLNLESSLTRVIGDLGFEMVYTKEEFRNLVNSMDLTTEEGQRMYATLLEISPAMAEYTDQLRSMNEEIANTALNNLRMAVEAEKSRASEEFRIAQEIHQGEMDMINSQRDQINGVISGAKDAYSQLEKSIEAEKKLADTQLSDKLASINAEKSQLGAMHSAQMNALKEQKSAAQNNHSEQMRALSAQKSSVTKNINSLKSLSSSLDKALESISGGLTATTALAQLDDALSSARSGDFGFDISGATSFFGGDIASSYSNLTDMLRDQGLAQNKVAELGDLTNTQLSVEERTLAQLEKSEELAISRHSGTLSRLDRQLEMADLNHQQDLARFDQQAEMAREEHEQNIEGLDSILLEAQSQLEKLEGVDNSVLTVDESLNLFQERLMEATFENAANELEKLNNLELIAQEELLKAEERYSSEIERWDSLLASNQSQLEAALGISNNVMSVKQAVDEVAMAISTISRPSQEFRETQYNPPINRQELENELLRELNNSNQATEDANKALAQHTSETVSILRRIEMNGLDTRVES